MKCDELKPYHVGYERQYYVYEATSVEEAIAELKAENERLKKEVWEADERAIDAGATSVEKMAELRATRRALWLARAYSAKEKYRMFYFSDTFGAPLNINGFSEPEKGANRMDITRNWKITFLKVERLCRAKAEEFKEVE